MTERPDLRSALEHHHDFDAGQLAGRRWAIGCVSLEVTQRCNLDCSLCYLSELSEAVLDLPLEELIRRIDVIADTYGGNIDIQISGGDPTLRPLADLVAHADQIDFVSFQLQADTGRGVLRERADSITQSRIEALIAQGAGVKPDFDSIRVGHPECNRFAMLFVAGGHAIDALAESSMVHRFVAATAGVEASRGTPVRTAVRFVAHAAASGFLFAGLGWLVRLAWRLRRGLPGGLALMLLRGRPPVHKLSLMTHNFMDQKLLVDERLDCCRRDPGQVAQGPCA